MLNTFTYSLGFVTLIILDPPPLKKKKPDSNTNELSLNIFGTISSVNAYHVHDCLEF